MEPVRDLQCSQEKNVDTFYQVNVSEIEMKLLHPKFRLETKLRNVHFLLLVIFILLLCDIICISIAALNVLFLNIYNIYASYIQILTVYSS